MKYRIIREATGGYTIEESKSRTSDNTWSWNYIEGTWSWTYLGARFELWCLIRRRERKPVVVYCVEVR